MSDDDPISPVQMDVLASTLGGFGGLMTANLGYELPQVTGFAERVQSITDPPLKTRGDVKRVLHQLFTFFLAELEANGVTRSGQPHVMSPEQIRDAVLLANRRHEEAGCANAPAGQPCWHDRCNMIAYLAHCLGVRGQRLMEQTAIIVGDYDKVCRDRKCRHSDN